MAHFLRHVLGIFVRQWAMGATTTDEDRRIAAAVPGAKGGLVIVRASVKTR